MVNEKDFNWEQIAIGSAKYDFLMKRFLKTDVSKGTGDYLVYANNYDNRIAEHASVDLQILGLGSDGHIAFNESNTPLID